jgi:hypothetical protein
MTVEQPMLATARKNEHRISLGAATAMPRHRAAPTRTSTVLQRKSPGSSPRGVQPTISFDRPAGEIDSFKSFETIAFIADLLMLT